jgi:hypothetical protein
MCLEMLVQLLLLGHGVPWSAIVLSIASIWFLYARSNKQADRYIGR